MLCTVLAPPAGTLLFRLTSDGSGQRQGFFIRYTVTLPTACAIAAISLDYAAVPLSSSYEGWLTSDKYRRGIVDSPSLEAVIPSEMLQQPEAFLMSYPPDCSYR